MSGGDNFDAFAAKWRAHWPEWRVLETFLPPAQRDLAVAWFALLQEFADAAWSGGEPAPGLAKLAWWQEELQGWQQGRRRHPLGSVLQAAHVPWQRLAQSMGALRMQELVNDSIDAALAALAGFDDAGAAVAEGLFGPPLPAQGLVATCCIAERMVSVQGAAAAPALRRHLASTVRAPRALRLHAAMLRMRLDGVTNGDGWRPAGRWRVLWTGWRAARD